jgi:MFS family permease
MEQRFAPQLAVIAAITATAAMGFSAIVPALPELAVELDVDPVAVGFLQSAVAIPGVLLTPFVGLLSDRLGRRRVLMWALASFGLFGVAGAIAPNYAVLLTLRLAMGVPYAGLLALTPVILADLFTGPTRIRAIGINTAALTVASTLGPIAGGLLATGGPQRAFLVYALAFPALLVARRLQLRETPVASAASPAVVLDELRRSGRLRDLLGAMPYTAIMMAIFVGFSFVVVPLYLEGDLGLSVAARGPVVGAANLGSAAASLLFARIAGRLSARAFLTMGQGLALLGLLTLWLARDVSIVVLGVLLLGLAIGTTYNTIQVFVASASPPGRRGFVVGTWSSSSRLGQVIGGSLGGGLVVLFGGRTSFLLGAAVVAVLAVVWLPLRRLADRAPL